MGLASSSNNNTSRIIMTGLDAAGKTTLLYHMKCGEVTTTIPTIGFNVETVSLSRRMDLVSWDVGGRCPMRPLWRHYFKGVQGLIYVVDSADVERICYAADELQRLLDEEALAGCPLLVLANKSDLPGALTADELTGYLRLTSDNKRLRHPDRRFAVFSICAASFDAAARKAFEWLSAEIKRTERGTESGGGVAVKATSTGKGTSATGESGKLAQLAENLLPKGLQRLLFT